ncbi:SURF1 family protein [Paracoccus caeni]|uniref:SURF1-like protein n=1 Tax=Paracoccus caeni TaxID=657651 RepID=A0A934VUP3_9RHOB|nr:SURF1 family protein [Paracoccus caeni]MBK4216031.1 SURF1 family protein [Paracoccus caeni]
MSLTRGQQAIIAISALVTVVLIGLGVWQVQRLGWKLDLIARVDERVAAQPVAAPGPADWPALTESADEYRRVTVSGRYAEGQDTLVQAVTALGPGFWVMTPLTTDDGWTLLINRGFVAADNRDDRPLPPGEVAVTGLLRLSQPDGAFLRANDPAAERWYSRDTAAIAETRGLSNTAPYFIDADRAGDAQPVGGLTVIHFRNNHLSYALTWFAMAAGLVLLTTFALRRDKSRSE